MDTPDMDHLPNGLLKKQRPDTNEFLLEEQNGSNNFEDTIKPLVRKVIYEDEDRNATLRLD